MTEEDVKEPWHKTWWGIVLIIIFWWVSIPYYIWKKTHWPLWAQIFATIVVVIVLLIPITSGQNATQVSQEQTTTSNDKPTEIKTLKAERDMYLDEKDKAFAKRDAALTERDKALTKLNETSSTLSKVQADLNSKIAAENQAQAETAKTTFSDGVYLVGTDMPPGRYKGTPNSGKAYWQISSDANGDNIISNGIEAGNFYVQVSAGQYLKIQEAEISLTK